MLSFIWTWAVLERCFFIQLAAFSQLQLLRSLSGINPYNKLSFIHTSATWVNFICMSSTSKHWNPFFKWLVLHYSLAEKHVSPCGKGPVQFCLCLEPTCLSCRKMCCMSILMQREESVQSLAPCRGDRPVPFQVPLVDSYPAWWP